MSGFNIPGLQHALQTSIRELETQNRENGLGSMPLHHSCLSTPPEKILNLFRSQTSLFSHILLGPDADRTIDEGLSLLIAVTYYDELLLFLSEHELHPDLKKCFDGMRRSLVQVVEFIKQVQICGDTRSSEATKAFSLEVAKRIFELSFGESYTFLGGWGGSRGHAVYYTFERSVDGYHIYLFQATPASFSDHGGVKTFFKEKPHPCRYYENVPSGLLFPDRDPQNNGLIHQLLELHIYPLRCSIMNPGYSTETLDEMFARFNPYQRRLPMPLLTRFATCQRAGTCATRSVDQWLFYLTIKNLPKEVTPPEILGVYKSLMIISKSMALNSAFSQYSDRPDLNNRLYRGARNLMRTCAKLRRGHPYITTEQFVEIEANAESILQKVNERISREQSSTAPLIIQPRILSEEHVFKKIISGSFQDHQTRPVQLKSRDLYKPLSEMSPLQGLQYVSNKIKSDLDEPHLSLMMIAELARTLPFPDDPYWKSLNKDERVKFARLIFELDDRYYEKLSAQKCTSLWALTTPHLTRMQFLLILWQIALKDDQDKRLEPYFPSVFTDYLHLFSRDETLFDSQDDVKRFNRLRKYAEDQIRDKNPILDILTFNQDCAELFKRSDYILAESLISGLSNKRLKVHFNEYLSRFKEFDKRVAAALFLLSDFNPNPKVPGLANLGFEPFIYVRLLALQECLFIKRADYRPLASLKCSISKDKEVWTLSLGAYTHPFNNSLKSLDFLHYPSQQTTQMCRSVANIRSENKQLALGNVPCEESLQYRMFCNPSMQPFAFAQWMLDHADLVDKSQPEQFWRFFFRTYEERSGELVTPLFTAIEEKQMGFLHSCRSFIAEALDAHYGLQPNKMPKVHESLFYVGIVHALTRTWRLIHHEAFPIVLIPNEKNLLIEWSSHPQIKEKLKAYIHLYLLSHFEALGKPVDDDDFPLVYQSLFAVKKYELLRLENNEYKDIRHICLIREWIEKFGMHAAARFTENPELGPRICEAVLKRKGLLNEGIAIHWERKSPLMFSAQDNEEEWQVDLLTLSIANRDGILSENIPMNLRFMSRILADRPVSLKRFQDTVWIQDQLLGTLRCKMQGDKITKISLRTKEGKWLHYIEPEAIRGHLPFCLVSDFTHWSEDTTKIHFISRKDGSLFSTLSLTKKIQIHSADGDCITPMEIKGSYLFSEGLVYEKNQKRRLVIPRFVGVDQRYLQFFLNEKGEYVYQLHPKYCIGSAPVNSPIGRFSEGLWLKHMESEGCYKLLIPKQKLDLKHVRSFDTIVSFPKPNDSIDRFFHRTMGYYEYDLDEDRILSDSAEGHLQLASIHLAQKQYAHALAHLMEISPADVLGSECKTYFDQLWEAHSIDNSPNACAVLIYAVYLYKRLLPFESANFFEIGDVYTDYLSGLNHVDAELRLSSDVTSFVFTYTSRSRTSNTCTQIEIPETTQTLTSLSEHLIGKALKVIPDQISLHQWHEYLNTLNPLPDLIPGKSYPPGRFVHDYTLLRMENTSPGKKDDLIFCILQTEKSGLIAILCGVYIDPGAYPNCLSDPMRVAKELELNSVFKGTKSNGVYELYRYLSSLTLDVAKNHRGKLAPSIKRPWAISTSINSYLMPSDPFERFQSPLKRRELIDFSKHQPDLITGRLVEQHLDLLPSPACSMTQVSFRIDESDLTINELPYRPAIDAECKKYEREFSEGCDQNQKILRYARLDAHSLEILLKDIAKAEEESLKLVEDLETYLLLKVSERPVDPSAARFEELFERGGITIKPTLKAILRAVNSKNPAESLRKLNPHLSDEDAAYILQVARQFLMEATVHHQLAKVVAALNKMDQLFKAGTDANDPSLQSYWEKACIDLTDQRMYDPETNMNALIFEYLSGLRVKAKQAFLIDHVLRALFDPKSPRSGVVFQLIMAGGKTSVILSTLLEMVAENDRVPFFLTHHSQYASVLGNLKTLQKVRFDKDVLIIDYTRLQMANFYVLKDIQRKLSEAKKTGCPIIMNTAVMQTIGLEFESTALRLSEKRATNEDQQRIEILGEILDFIAQQGLGIFDEIDLNLSIQLGVHFPRGDKKSLQPERIQLVRKLYEFLVRDPVLNEIVDLESNKQGEMALDVYHQRVKPLLATLLADNYSKELHLPSEHKKAFTRYITGEMSKKMERVVLQQEQVPLNSQETEDVAFLHYLHRQLAISPLEKMRKAAGLMALSKEMLIEILPHTLSKSYNRHYGRAPIDAHPEDAGKICPYLGVGKPSKNEFGNTEEVISFNFQTVSYSKTGVSRDQVLYLARSMRQAANIFSMLNRERFDDTAEAQTFKELTGVPIERIEEPEILQQAVDFINRDIKKRLDIEAETVHRVETLNPEILSSSSISVVNMFKQSVGCSGTPWNASTYHDALSDVVFDDGAEGKIIGKILSDEKLGHSKMFSLNASEPAILLKEFLEKHDYPERVRGLADTGGWFKEFTTYQVACQILDVYKDKPYIQAVLFHWTNPTTNQEEFAILKKGEAIPRPLRNTQLSEIMKYGVPLEQIFVYYDELRTTGTDIPQCAYAINIVTIDPLNLTIRSFLQSILRLRDYFYGQRTDFVYPAHLSHLIINNGKSLTGLMQTLIKNQAIELAKQTKKAYIQNIYEVFRNYVHHRLVEIAKSKKPVGPFAEMFKPFISSTVSDDLFKMYGSLEDEESTYEYLKQMADQQMELFKNCGANEVDVKAVAVELRKILEKSKIDTALPKTMVASMNRDLIGSHVEINREKALEVESQKQIEINRELLLELAAYRQDDSSLPLNEVNWTNAGSSDLNSLLGPSILTLASGFKATFAKHQTLGSNSHVPDYGVLFPENLEMTSNFHQSVEGAALSFSRSQKPGDQILVYQDPEGKTRFRLLSLIDADFFRQWIASKKPQNVWLMNPRGHLIESRGNSLPSKSEKPDFYSDLKLGLWWINFFNGNTPFLSRKRIMTENLLDAGKNYQLMLRYLKVRTYNTSVQKAVFETDALYHPDDVAMQTQVKAFICGKRLEAEERRRTKLADLADEDIANLRPNDVAYIPAEKVDRLKDETQIRRIPLLNVEFVSYLQVPFLSLKQIPYLKTMEQVQALGADPEKIQCLKDWQVPLISEEQVPYLTDEQIPFVPDRLINLIDSKRWGALDPLQIPFIDNVQWLSEPFIQDITLDQVSRLADHQIPWLSKPEQIAAVRLDQGRLISKSQWDILIASGMEVINDHVGQLIQTIEEVSGLDSRFVKYFSDSQRRAFFRDPAFVLKDPTLVQYMLPDEINTTITDPMVPYLPLEVVRQFSALKSEDIRRIPLLTPSQMTVLDSSLYPFIDLKWVKDIKDKGFLRAYYNARKVSRLDPRFIPLLTMDELRKIPEDLVVHCEPEQIQQFDPQKDAKRVTSLKPEQLVDLPENLFGLLSDPQIKAIRTADAVPKVPISKVGLLHDTMLQHLPLDPEKLKQVRPFKTKYLTPHQSRIRGA